MPKPVVIAGAGNVAAADDGVGVHAVRELPGGEELPEGVRLLEIGVLGPDAIAYVDADEGVVFLDAVRGGGRPGTIYRIDLADVEEPDAAPLSVHELGLPVLLREARLLGRPLRGVLLGVEPARLDPPSTELSPPVAAALPRLKEAALAEARLLGMRA